MVQCAFCHTCMRFHTAATNMFLLPLPLLLAAARPTGRDGQGWCASAGSRQEWTSSWSAQVSGVTGNATGWAAAAQVCIQLQCRLC
jgi:hypothetical protein